MEQTPGFETTKLPLYSLCKRTITDLGGEIELRSQEGVGTQMLVELPTASFGSLKAPPPIVAH
ncbi:MAG: hypothetical protein GY847_06960 [Proteobacteria bacterium]|nr:hypothetical protein [Pseudomonadota bacterium]